MGLHHLTWRVTSSGLEDEMVIAEAISVLIGKEDLVEIEKTTSHHGSNIFIINASTKQNKVALNSLSNLGKELLDELISSIEERLDENNTIHFRLDLDDLISGYVNLLIGNKKSVKCRAKLEVYPGQSAVEEATKILSSAKEIAEF